MVIRLTAPNLIYIVFRHRLAILGCFFTFSLLAIAYCLVATPKYQGQVSLVVNFSQLYSGAPGDSQQANASAAPDREQIINSYLLELQSSSLAEDVIKSFGLARLYPSVVGGPNPLNPLGWLALLFPGDPADKEKAQMESAIYQFTVKDLQVETARDSNVIVVSLLNPDRELAREAVDLLVEKFREREAQIGRNPRLEFVQGQVEFYQNKVLEAQAAMEAFRVKNGITSLEDEQTALLQRRSDQEAAFAATQTRVAEDKQKSTTLDTQLGQISPLMTTTTGTLDPLVLSARTTLGSLVTTEGKIGQIYGAGSPAVTDIQSQISDMERLIKREAPQSQLDTTAPNTTYQQIQVALLSARSDLEAAKRSLEIQQKQLDEINSRIEALNRAQGPFQNLTREYQLADQNYSLYLQGVQKARVDEDLNKQKISSIAVFDPAEAPSRPARPRVALIILAGMLSGLLIGFALAYATEQLDERMNLPWQVTDNLNLPVLGSMGVMRSSSEG